MRTGSIRTLIAILCSILLVAVALIASSSPANALNVTGSSSPVTGNATYFSGLGSPYGGCGLPQADLDSQNFLALNVYNTPGDYGSEPRPIPASDASIMGMFDNGLNCGRYVQVTVGDYCTGTNDGAQNEPFCRNGSWVADQYNGATLTFVVADSCADSNAWCRDDPYHVDLAQNSLSQFLLNGQPTTGLPSKWNNRQVSWQFVAAPNYTGDIGIGFIQGAQTWWSAIAISHLPNGIHGVRYYANGAWQSGTMDSDMGDDYIIAPTTSGGSQYEIQVIDASDSLLNGGEVYSFSMPTSCGTQCSAAYTAATYTTSTGPTTSPSPSTSASTSASPTATTPTGTSGAQCTATVTTTSSWTGGYQLSITVENTGTTATSTWKTALTLPGSDTLSNAWNATATQSGQSVTAVAASYNAQLASHASTSWGMTVTGSGPPPTSATCASS